MRNLVIHFQGILSKTKIVSYINRKKTINVENLKLVLYLIAHKSQNSLIIISCQANAIMNIW